MWVLAVLAACSLLWAVLTHLRWRLTTMRLRAEHDRCELLSEQLRIVSGLHDAGRAVNSARELDHVLQTILSGAVEMLGASTGSVMLRDGEGLRGVAAVGNDRAIGVRVALGEGIAGQVAANRAPLLINGTASPHSFPGLGPRSTRVHSAVSVPMVERDELIGVLNVGAPASHRFDEKSLNTVSAFAEYAAAAIAKARLYDSSRRKSEELAYRATHDALTGLPNRTMLRDNVVRAGGVRERGAGGALLYIDLDGFKAVNDLLGHAGGEVLLEAVARRIAASVSTDDTAARVGGDEFAVFLPSASDLGPAVTVAERLIDRLAEKFVVQEQMVTVSASVGIALLGVHGETFEELMRAADRALYDAKTAGKNRWHMCPVDPETVMSALPPQRRSLPTPAGGAPWPSLH
jgi:diguanylate cyclase (GGDEF)-like protein